MSEDAWDCVFEFRSAGRLVQCGRPKNHDWHLMPGHPPFKKNRHPYTPPRSAQTSSGKVPKVGTEKRP